MRLHPVGFSHLGQVNADGIRYVWQLRDNAPYIESAAFRARAKIPTSDADSHISAYTTSVSGGCALTAALQTAAKGNQMPLKLNVKLMCLLVSSRYSSCVCAPQLSSPATPISHSMRS